MDLPKHRSCAPGYRNDARMDVDTFSVYPEIMRKDLDTWRLTRKALTVK
ncbi:hypothetical protein [Vibrio sp.]